MPADAPIALLEGLEARLRWLSAWTIHNANHLREQPDGLKVGGHQASCASITAIMAALYFHALGPHDKVAVKPHAGPVLHAIHYLLGNQSLDQLQRFRGFGGAQSYPVATKDRIPVDFSTGSVGLGVAVTAFASLVQDYLIAHGRLAEADAGRMIALMGDAELDEGNIYECLIEGYKHDIRNCWWIVDYNRQSLDHTTADRMFDRFDDIFGTCGWRVVTLKYGKLQRAAFARPGGPALERLDRRLPQRRFRRADLPGRRGVARAADGRHRRQAATSPSCSRLTTTTALAALMTNLGGHCIETLVEAFAAAQRRSADAVHRLYDQGLRPAVRGAQGQSCGADEPRPDRGAARRPWASPRATSGSRMRGWATMPPRRCGRSSTHRRFARASGRAAADRRPGAVPDLPVPDGEEQSTQAAFGRILLDLAKSASERGARRPHRHHLARRDRVDQSRRVREPARAVPAQRA